MFATTYVGPRLPVYVTDDGATFVGTLFNVRETGLIAKVPNSKFRVMCIVRLKAWKGN